MSAPGDADPRGVALPTVDETFVLIALCRTNEEFAVLKFSRLESDTGLDRKTGQFRTKIDAALSNVQGSLHAFGRDSEKAVNSIVMSSDVTLGRPKPADPGVAVWFTWDGLTVCIAVDRYATVEANLQAIHHILEARRVELRHGTLALVRAAMTGFQALPAPRERAWYEVLGCAPDASPEQIGAAYRAAAAKAHPDALGGSHDAMTAVNAARDEGLRR